MPVAYSRCLGHTGRAPLLLGLDPTARSTQPRRPVLQSLRGLRLVAVSRDVLPADTQAGLDGPEAPGRRAGNFMPLVRVALSPEPHRRPRAAVRAASGMSRTGPRHGSHSSGQPGARAPEARTTPDGAVA